MGMGFVQFLCRPGGAPPLRTVIAIAERMPEVGRQFYETGPAFGIAQLKGYLNAQVAAGVLGGGGLRGRRRAVHGLLAWRPCSSRSCSISARPRAGRIEYVVKIAVRAFLAAYRAR